MPPEVFAWTAALEDGSIYANGRDTTAHRENEAALRADGRIDLLITDVGLPGGMNGR